MGPKQHKTDIQKKRKKKKNGNISLPGGLFLSECKNSIRKRKLDANGFLCIWICMSALIVFCLVFFFFYFQVPKSIGMVQIRTVIHTHIHMLIMSFTFFFVLFSRLWDKKSKISFSHKKLHRNRLFNARQFVTQTKQNVSIAR